MSLRPVAVALALLAALSCGAEQRPLDEMGGRCRDYRMNLGPELALWRSPAIAREAARTGADAVADLSLRQRYRIALHPVAEVALVLPAESGTASDHAGLVRVRIPGSGFYRVSLGGAYSVQVADGARPVAVHEFEMQSRCDSIYKSIEYTLRAGKTYTIQILAPAAAEVDLLVTARR